MEELETVLWELESAGGRPSRLSVSLEFWRHIQGSRHVILSQNGDIHYKYLEVTIDPHQETNFLLY